MHVPGSGGINWSPVNRFFDGFGDGLNWFGNNFLKSDGWGGSFDYFTGASYYLGGGGTNGISGHSNFGGSHGSGSGGAHGGTDNSSYTDNSKPRETKEQRVERQITEVERMIKRSIGDAGSNGGSIPTLEGVSIDLLYGAFLDYIPINGMSISFMKDSREYIGISLTFNMNGQGLEGTWVGVNTINGHRLDGKSLNIEDTFGPGNTTSYGIGFVSYSSSSNTYYDYYSSQQFQIDSYGPSMGFNGAFANYETYTVGFSMPSLPALIKKWINY